MQLSKPIEIFIVMDNGSLISVIKTQQLVLVALLKYFTCDFPVRVLFFFFVPHSMTLILKRTIL